VSIDVPSHSFTGLRPDHAVKFFSSWKWKPDFEEAAASFEEHKKAIQHVLLLHISIGVNETNNTLQSMQEDVLLVKAAFEHVLSPAEVDLSSFVEGKGGREEVLKDDRSLQKMLDKQKPSKDVKKSAKPESEYLDLTVSDFKEEVGREVKDVLLEYQSIFERGFKARFEMIESSFLDLKGTVKDEGERVIRVVKENMTGAHQRITNKVRVDLALLSLPHNPYQELRKVWKEMVRLPYVFKPNKSLANEFGTLKGMEGQRKSQASCIGTA